MELRDRKLINNAKHILPKFGLGFTPPSLNDILQEAGNFNFAGQTQGVTSAADAFKADIMALNNAATDTLPSFKKTNFLKKNAGSMMETGMQLVGAVNQLNAAGKTSINANNLIGSNGTNTETTNGLSTELLNRIDSGAAVQQAKAERTGAIMNMASTGAQIGSKLGPIGAAVGGVLGGIAGGIFGNKAKREAMRQIRIAETTTNTINADRLTDTESKAMQMLADREYGNQGRQSLFHAALGTEADVDPRTGLTKGTHLIDTAYGMRKGKGNSYTEKGELIISGKEDGSGMHQTHRVKRGPNDSALSYLDENDTVANNRFKYLGTNKTVAQVAAERAAANGGKLSTEDKEDIEMNLKIGRSLLYLKRYKNGLPANALGEEPYHIAPMVQRYLNPKFTDKWYDTADEIGNSWFDNGNMIAITPAKAPVVPSNGVSGTTGTITPTGNKPSLFGNLKNAIGRLNGVRFNNLDNIIPTVSGLMIAGQQYRDASGPLRAPQSYTSNQYEDAALSKLGQLRQDYYPVWAQLREHEGRGKNAILQSGGFGAEQRALAFMGLANQTQQNGMNAMFEHQNRQNALDAQWANAALQAGAQTASRKMAAKQWNEEMLAKAHNAQLYGKQMGLYNAQNALEQYFANKFKKQQFDDTMSLYRDNQKLDAENLKTMLNNLNNTGDYKYESTGVPGNAAMPTLDPKTGSFVGKNPFVEAAMKLNPNTSNMSGYVNGAASILKNLGIPLTKTESTQTIKPRVKRNTKKTKGGKK